MRRGFALALVAAFTTLIGSAHAADENSFNARCATCHQQNAQGLPGMYPPLADSIGNELRLKRGREYLIEVVLNGMAGSIEVNGTTYVGLMPEFASAKRHALTVIAFCRLRRGLQSSPKIL